jgi:hypothetical protein
MSDGESAAIDPIQPATESMSVPNAHMIFGHLFPPDELPTGSFLPSNAIGREAMIPLNERCRPKLAKELRDFSAAIFTT